MKREQTLDPGESIHTLHTFVSVHQGDYFRTLTEYRRLMIRQGFQMATAPDSAFGPIWCAWGYGRNVQLKQVYDTLPTAKKLGFSWVTLDDGWQNSYGDWQLDPKKFPNGDADMKALVDRIHQEGFRAQLWWSPLSAVPDSKLLKDHPDYVLLNRDGTRRKIRPARRPGRHRPRVRPAHLGRAQAARQRGKRGKRRSGQPRPGPAPLGHRPLPAGRPAGLGRARRRRAPPALRRALPGRAAAARPDQDDR
jgi:hypothetical protein